ncbi:MAG: type II toxin-antitoxin system HicA family toxin [Defluviitaleaceae bacterium]|nr:type II toxin-antitoxin system HicA family toxin [Defluviitaleaceae bacterium]
MRELLKQHGCYFVRQGKGSHEGWFSPITNKPVSVSMNIKSRHTANAILKKAGILHKL